MNATRARQMAEPWSCGHFGNLTGWRCRNAICRPALPLFLLVVVATLMAGHETAVGQTRSAAGLQYPWSKGDEIAYSFDIEAQVQGSVMNIKGSCNYRPRKAGESDADGRSGTGTGTAFVVNGNGYLVTCATSFKAVPSLWSSWARTSWPPRWWRSIANTTWPC